MPRIFAMLCAMVVVAVLVACGGETDPATSITTSSATLNGKATCKADSDGAYAWQISEDGGAFTQVGGNVDFDCPPDQRADLAGYQWSATDTDPNTAGFQDQPPIPIAQNAAGLSASTPYRYRLLATFSNGSQAWADANGATNGVAYDDFITDANPSVVCDDTQAAGESVTAFIESNGAGTAGNPQDLCLRDGSYNLGGAYTGLENYQYLKAGPDTSGDGTRAEVSITGEFMVDETGVTIESIRLVRGTNHMVITVTGEDVTLRHVEVDGLDAANVPLYSGLQIGNSSGNRATNTRVVSSFFHDIGDIQNRTVPPGGPDDRGHDHAIYCVDGSGAVIEGSWFTSNADGYSFHWYPDCDNSVVRSNIAHDTSHGGVIANDSSGNLFDNNIFTDIEGWYRPNRRTVGCSSLTGTGNAVSDFVDNPNSTQECGSQLGHTGERTTAPTYVNEAGRDFRLTAGSAHRDLMGVFADVKAGVLP